MATAVKEKQPSGAVTASSGKQGSYLAEVQREMRKVSWPKRTELVNNTIITLVASGLLALFIFGIDRVISLLLQLVYGA